jgi:quercetin dioxygenase-like cupin family protein
MIEQIRAVITSSGVDGSALFDRAVVVEPMARPGGGGVEQWTVWGTADGVGVVGDPGSAAVHTPPFPGAGGTRFFVVRLPAGLSGAFHATDTIDYGVVIEGEIVLDLGDGGREVLSAGTCVVQRGSRHAWRNETTEPALVAFVVIGARRPPDPAPTPADHVRQS